MGDSGLCWCVCVTSQVEFMYLVFTRMPGKSYCRRLRSLLLCLCDVFRPFCVDCIPLNLAAETDRVLHAKWIVTARRAGEERGCGSDSTLKQTGGSTTQTTPLTATSTASWRYAQSPQTAKRLHTPAQPFTDNSSHARQGGFLHYVP